MRRYLDFGGLTLFFALCLGAAFLSGYYTRALSATYPALRWPLPGLAEAEGEYPLLAEVAALVKTHYNGQLPESKTLEHGAVRGYVGAIGDPYTVFIEPDNAELETQSLQGEYGGIGVDIRKNDQGEIVLAPFLDSPAAASGIQEGDVLLQVDQIPVTPEMTADDVTVLIRGPVGTTVTLRVRHPDGVEASLSIQRQTIELPSVSWRMVEGQPDVGLIALSRFSSKTARELERAVQDLQARGATRFILDLRNNGGGLLDAAVDVAGQFLNGGVVMYEKRKDGAEETLTAPNSGGLLTQAPLAVLVNGNTASAAEILAGALLDRGRAPLIGQKTFGKGSVQLVFPLSDGSSLHITANLWFTPSRRQLDKIGLPPTIAVEPLNDGSDPELARALEFLANGK